MKKLYKSEDNKVFSGVIGGIGEYYDTDPVLLRLVYILITVLTGVFPCIVGYVIASIIVPDKPRIHFASTENKSEPKSDESIK